MKFFFRRASKVILISTLLAVLLLAHSTAFATFGQDNVSSIVQTTDQDYIPFFAFELNDQDGIHSLEISATGQDIADYANSGEFLGIRYVKCGMSTKGFDCSGLVCYVYQHFGYELPHFTGDLKKLGTEISKTDLQPGDLVFFRNYRHVGIYLENGEFIHASSGKGEVIVSTLLEGYYCDHYAGARRII